MKASGFITRQEATKPARVSKSSRNRPAAFMQGIGEKGAEGMNPAARSPAMEPRGALQEGTPGIYVLGSAPTEIDDGSGHPGTSPTVAAIRREARKSGVKTRHNNTVRTLPITGRDKANRKLRIPTSEEIECFRLGIENDIVKTNPSAILALGKTAMRWFVPEIGSAQVGRGRAFTIEIKGKPFRVFMAEDPDIVESLGRSALGKSARTVYESDIAKAIEYAARNQTAKPIEFSKEEALKGCKIHHPESGSFEALTAALKRMAKGSGPMACDLETRNLRPYKNDSCILSVSFTDKEETHAYVYEHPRFAWSAQKLKVIRELTRRVLVSGRPISFHNLQFDLEWLCSAYGPDIVWEANLQCSLAQGFCIDERVGALSMDFLCRQHFGIDLKKLSNLDRANLVIYEVDKLLNYNALDTKWGLKLYLRQRSIIKAENLQRVYKDQRERIPMLAWAQYQGIEIDQSRVDDLIAQINEQLEKAKKTLYSSPEVRKYRKRFGDFGYSKNADVARLVVEIMGKASKITNEDGKVSVDEKHLQALGGDIATSILEVRKLEKLLSTYVLSLKSETPNTVLWEDGKIHTNFNHARTATRRLSSSGPNMQNFPKRNPRAKEIRRAFKPSEGMVYVSADYGQIEWRVIGIISQDDYMDEALWSGIDVHMEYAEKLVKLNPQVCLDRYGDFSDKSMKRLRGDVKNQLVFPLCYGASLRSVAKSCETPETKFKKLYEEFWDRLPKVRSWQRQTQKFAERNGYVETLTGYRRHCPMTSNEIINSPIQGTASDLTVNAMVRLSKLAYSLDMPHLQPVINIHDDITFVIPKSELDEHVEVIVKAMLSPPYDWITCPIVAEVESGPDWYSVEPIGEYSSVEVLGHKRGHRLPRSSF